MRHVILLFLITAPLMAEPLKPSSALFRTPEFKERFVGSYGFLPKVEPKVDRDEAQVIAELAEMLSGSKFRQAEKRLLEFIKERKNPTDPEKESKAVSAALIFTLANLYYQNGRLVDAEKAYKIAIKRHPDYRRAHKNLALLYARSERMGQAKPYLMRAIELGETDHLSFGLLGHAMLADEKFLAAEVAFRQAYLLKPDEKDWQMGLAQALLAKEDWVQSASMLQSLIDDDPENALLWKQQANCFIQNDEVMRAAENYEVLRLKGLADETSLNQLGDIYANQEEPLLALGAYLSAIQKSDKVKVARSLKAAKYLLQLEAPREAARLMKELNELGGKAMTNDQRVAALVVESDIAKAESEMEKASSFLEKALEVQPSNGEVRVRLGQLFAKRAEAAESEEKARHFKMEARTNFELAANHADVEIGYQANLRYAQMLVKEAQYIKALPKLEQAVRLKKGSKQSVEQYLRRVQRAADREEAKNKRMELEREERKEKDRKLAEAAKGEG